MNRDMMELLIRSAFEAADPGGAITFSFQGGEPTLAGLAFYEDFLQTERRYVNPDVRISHAIQTNGMLIDTDWAKFFQKEHFLVGVSIDGEEVTHDLHRVDSTGRGTWKRAKAALETLDNFGVETNLLCVVTRAAARYPGRTYDSLLKLGARYLQFFPCLDPYDSERGGMSYSLLPKAYGGFLCKLFDRWYFDWQRGQYTSIRLFDDYVHLFMGCPAGSCATNGSCGDYLVVESDGSLYPCDFFVEESWKIGSLSDGTSLSEMMINAQMKRFRNIRYCNPAECGACKWVRVCRSGCVRDWVRDDHGMRNYYCSSFQMFFEYAAQRLELIARKETAMQKQIQQRYSINLHR
jgi:uncharacterized protein